MVALDIAINCDFTIEIPRLTSVTSCFLLFFIGSNMVPQPNCGPPHIRTHNLTN